MAEPDLSVLIVSFNDSEVLLPCLESIYLSSPRIEMEIIVVDNGSRDSTVRRLRERFPQVALIEAGYNAGYAGGNNFAFRKARGRFVLFLNPDTLVRPGALEGLVARADSLPDLGALGPNVVNEDGSLQRSCFRSPRLLDFFDSFMLSRVPGYARCFGYLGYRDEDYRRDMEVDAVSGCSLLARRELLERIGAFDEEYFVYFEEADLCERVRASGHKVYYTPAASIVHLGGVTTRRQEAWFRIQAERSRQRFFVKHRGRLSVVALRPLRFISSVMRLLYATAALVLSAGLWKRVRRKPLTELVLLGWQLGIVEQGRRPS